MVDHGSVVPLYEQLADELERKIRAGEYAPGQRLPSADDLAELYDIAPNTALKGLQLLRERGHAEMAHGRGTYVRRTLPVASCTAVPSVSVAYACQRLDSRGLK